MFLLFKKPEVSIRSVSISDLGWENIKNEPNIIQWHDPKNPNVLSLNFFKLPPDIPIIKDINVLRNYYRTLVSNAGGGLIQVDEFQRRKLTFVKTLFKNYRGEQGVSYIAALTIPFMSCSFVRLKIWLKNNQCKFTKAKADSILNAAGYPMLISN
jgi:hypothetical protein